MSERVLVLGAGFGGLELATSLSEAFGEDAGVTLVEHADAFVFGYSKLDVMFGHAEPDAGEYEADVLVVALGADYDLDATPGLAEGGHEFYSVAGAERLCEVLPT